MEVVVGYVFAWLTGKAKRAGRRVDGELDRTVDAAVDGISERLHRLVAAKLQGDPAFQRLEDEADQGHAEPTERTRQRVVLALDDAGEADAGFASAIEELVGALRAAGSGPVTVSADGGGIAVGGNVAVDADHGSVAAQRIDGGVVIGNPREPSPGKP